MVHDVLQEHTFSQLRHKYFLKRFTRRWYPQSSMEVHMGFRWNFHRNKLVVSLAPWKSTIYLPVYPKKTHPYTRFFLTAKAPENRPKPLQDFRRKSWNPPFSGANHSHVSFSAKIKNFIFPPPKKSSKKPSNWYWSPSPRHASQSNRFQEEWNWAKPMPIPNLGWDHFTVDVGDEFYDPGHVGDNFIRQCKASRN